MKNIETILKEAGIEVTDEQLAKIKPAVNENYKTIADYDKQKEKLTTLESTLAETQKALEKFEGVDTEKLQSEIDALKKSLADKDADLKKKDDDYAAQIKARDFSDLIEKEIAKVNGKNAKAIRALLDEKALAESNNQQADVAKALAALVEAEDSAMLFGEPEPQNLGSGNPIGSVKKTQAPDTTTMSSALTEYYSTK